MKRPLSPTQALVLGALTDAARAKAYCPTNRELTERFDCEYPGKVIQSLERRKLITVKRYARSRQVAICGQRMKTAEPQIKTPHWRGLS